MIDKKELLRLLQKQFEETKKSISEDWKESKDFSYSVDCSEKIGYAKDL